MNAQKHTRFIVITPVRDEAQYIEKTIRSMKEQTVLPAQWIIVNDGSVDGTANIIDSWASKLPWIAPVHRAESARGGAERSTSRGKRAQAAKEIEAFWAGFEHVTEADWEFLVKLDGDVAFEPDYFERCFAEFEAAPGLGIGGGLIHNLRNGQPERESTPRFHVRGATKIYRRACWDDIGGVRCGPAWDTLDEVKANMLGWTTATFTHLTVLHYRYTGAANGVWRNAVKNGTWCYIAGYHPLFFLCRCARAVIRRPYLVRSAGLLYGFLLGYLQRAERIQDKALIHYLRKCQLRSLLFRETTWR